MNPMRRLIVASVSLVAASATLYAFAPGASLANDISPLTHDIPLLAQSSAGPPQAPSFLKQAGQKLLQNAQKELLQNVNQKLNPSTNGATSSGTAVNISAPRQPAPCRCWIMPGERPIACLLCIHGLGLSSKSYEYFGSEQSKRGLAVYAIDVRGFGAWMNAKGKTKVNFDDCLADIKQALESIRAAHPGIPVYILGESMGGAIALRAASMYPDLIDGLISSVPAGERFNQGKTSLKVFLNLLSGFDVTNLGNDVLNQATQNIKLKSQWKDDPLARLDLTPQELIQFQDFMNNNHEAAKKVADMPVLFVQGNGDKLVKPEGTWELFNSVAAKDKSFFSVPGEHLIFEEAQTQEAGPRDQNFRVISSWLSTKVGRRMRFGRRVAYGGPGMGSALDGAMGGGMGAGMSNTIGGGMRSGITGGTPGYTSGGIAGGTTGYTGSGIAAGAPGYTSGGMAGGALASFVNVQGLEGPAQMIDNGQYANAISELERISAQRPYDQNVFGLLGRAYYLSGQPDKAGYYFRRAMRMGRAGGTQARGWNSFLLDLSRQAQLALQGNVQAGAATSSFPFAGFGGVSATSSAAGSWGTNGSSTTY
ncbi:MAG TPA: alpha/beta fold hydrolase, partial [Candidatus Obscuribacterales bacterium]